MVVMRPLLLFVLFILSYPLYAQQLSPQERELYDLIMQYRRTRGLPSIPLSRNLTYVAQTHVKDLTENNPVTDRCNLHSWSSNGNWTPCCYTSDHAQAACLWNKPRELTPYQGNGYEISFWSSGGATPRGSLASWQNSPGHNALIINSSYWQDTWNAIGVGINGNYAVVWFGKEPDTY